MHNGGVYGNGALLKAPFPRQAYFGGKSRVAAHVWSRFGSVANYCEPFFGSGAVLLGRHQPFTGTETVNDLNGWLANFWRSLAADPDAVAYYADYPVSELDLHARGDWLFYRPGVAEWIEQLRADPDFYDVKSAGWWVWGQCAWIGSGWGPRPSKEMWRQLPHLGDAGQGINRKRPELLSRKGVHRASLADDSETPHGVALRDYLRQLSDRLRGVRICCGDWSRVLGPTPTIKLGTTAVFLDPPYSVADRTDVYDSFEDRSLAAAMQAWCRTWGEHRDFRIALCGYFGEYDLPGWECWAWKAHGGYGGQAAEGNENTNAARERIWFSPFCERRPTLFDTLAAVPS